MIKRERSEGSFFLVRAHKSGPDWEDLRWPRINFSISRKEEDAKAT